MSREIATPLDIEPCGCGAERVIETVDGHCCRYDCTGCGETIADFSRKATP